MRVTSFLAIIKGNVAVSKNFYFILSVIQFSSVQFCSVQFSSVLSSSALLWHARVIILRHVQMSLLFEILRLFTVKVVARFRISVAL